MSKPRDERQKDLFRPDLEQIIDMGHPLVRLAGEIDWATWSGASPRSVRRAPASRRCRPA